MTDDDESPASRGQRFMELAKMTTSVAGNYAKDRVTSLFKSDEASEQSRNETQRRNGEIVAETLGDLKGAAMKIGQMASVATDVLPDELAEPLEELQDDAPPMDYEVVAEQIESELGAPPPMLFDRFERKPFASASIGQVHRAVTDGGRRAVVKVQYPGIDNSVDSDLDQLKLALRMSGLVNSNRKEALDRLFAEIRERLHEELDYCNEADNVRLFGEMHADDDWILVPEVIGERSSKRVLTMTELRGDDLETVCEEYDWSQKDEIGTRLFQLFGLQAFRHGAFHADPNPANYAFRPEGRIVLYDYGCVKKLEDEQRRVYAEILRASMNQNYERVDEMMWELGGRAEGTELDPDFYKKLHHIMFEPVMERELYDYGEGLVQRRVEDNTDLFVRHEEAFQPPPGGVYVDRTIVGIHNILRQLKAEVPCGRILDQYMEYADQRSAEIDRQD